MKQIKNLFLLSLLALSLTSCSDKNVENSSKYDTETIHQVSLLQGLMLGDYYGSISVKELKQMGDTAIGTFDKLDGELIMTDGVVYKAKHDGSIEVVSDDELIPFSNVTKFDKDFELKINQETNYNHYYMTKITGTFSKMNVRSEKPQQTPYKPLVDVLKTDQTFFDYENIEGTVVALYMPPYMGTLNTTGWHLHFISKDRKKGGHILNLSISSAVVEMDQTNGFEVYIPEGEYFKSLDLTVDQDDDIKEVEQGN